MNYAEWDARLTEMRHRVQKQLTYLKIFGCGPEKIALEEAKLQCLEAGMMPPEDDRATFQIVRIQDEVIFLKSLDHCDCGGPKGHVPGGSGDCPRIRRCGC